MTSPKKGIGKTSEWREDLNSLRRKNPDAFKEEVERAKRIYALLGSIEKTANELGVSKRTFERAMVDIAELGTAINAVRARA